MYLIRHRRDFKTLESDKIIKQLKNDFKAYEPMYKFLLRISDEYVSTI